jgi:putative ABC transport system permease protein
MKLTRAVHTQLFWGMLRRSLLARSGHTRTALLALTIAAATATAMLTLYLDLDAKLHKEFRRYGANIIVNARESQAFNDDIITAIRSALPTNSLAVPFGYAVAHTADGTAIVVSGTDMNLVKQLNHWWSVSSWPSAPGEALVGERALRSLDSQRGPYTLHFGDKPLQLSLAGTLKTGSDEENRVYVALSDFTNWTGLNASAVEISVSGSREQINSVISQLKNVVPMAGVRPIRQIVEAEAGVISKTKLLMLSALLLIGITVALCVLATLTTSILERRRDFAVMKALGSSQRMLNALFASEALFLGLSGALFGYALGLGVAAWIEKINFHATVLPRFSVFPLVVFGTVAIALLASLFPLTKLQRLEPAGILRGE